MAGNRCGTWIICARTCAKRAYPSEFGGSRLAVLRTGNDPSLTEAVEVRLAAALEAGDTLDARVVLLTLYASVIQPSVVERYGLGAG